MGPVLEARGLTKIYTPRGRPPVPGALDVTFRLEPGETLGVLGRSGCGKSTLARLLCGLEAPTRGTLLLQGREAAGPEQLWRQVQMVFQTAGGSFDPRRTLGDGIGESLRNTGVPAARRRAQVAALLEQCGLPADFARRYPHQVSGGEAQRAAIARALAIGPQVLICDEATSSLDVQVQRQVLELLERLRQERGLTCLFISHSPALVRRFCRRVLVMERGQVVEEGPVEQVFARPGSAAAQALLEAAL